MIPKKIHYCWFGHNPIPPKFQAYIKSWSRLMPDWEIIRWDESNFDVNANPFIARQYAQAQFAFVSDYARFKILYDHGGLYLDTDVELIRSLEDIIAQGPFMAFEKNSNLKPGEILNVNVGLGFALDKGNPIAKEIIDIYESDPHKETVVTLTTRVLKNHGLNRSDSIQEVAGIRIYPADYFCPLEFCTSKIRITPNTRSIHHYSSSWLSRREKLLILRGFYLDKIRKLLNLH